jgi:hypothetical protein
MFAKSGVTCDVDGASQSFSSSDELEKLRNFSSQPRPCDALKEPHHVATHNDGCPFEKNDAIIGSAGLATYPTTDATRVFHDRT